MSKSLKRVATALAEAGVSTDILEMPGETRTAADAAREADCEIDQIAKSIIFRGETSGQAIVFVTAGGNQVEPSKAASCAGEPLARADADFIRKTTGFAIGGVSPVGHTSPPRLFFDPRLQSYKVVFAAAGTPRHIFPISPPELLRVTGATIADFTA